MSNDCATTNISRWHASSKRTNGIKNKALAAVAIIGGLHLSLLKESEEGKKNPDLLFATNAASSVLLSIRLSAPPALTERQNISAATPQEATKMLPRPFRCRRQTPALHQSSFSSTAIWTTNNRIERELHFKMEASSANTRQLQNFPPNSGRHHASALCKCIFMMAATSSGRYGGGIMVSVMAWA